MAVEVHSLREWRYLLGVSVTALHRRSGISRAAIYDIESGKSRGMISTLAALAEALGIEPYQIREYQRLWEKQKKAS